MSSGRIRLRKWNSSLFVIDSQSISSLNCGRKSLNKRTWNRRKLVVMKIVFSHLSKVSSRAWRALLRRTRIATIWNCFLSLEPLEFRFWQNLHRYEAYMGSIHPIRKHESEKIFSLKCQDFLEVLTSWDQNEAEMNKFILNKFFFQK